MIHRIMPRTHLLCALALALPLLPAQGPKVLELSPAHGSAGLDASKIKELKITFDRDMRRDSHSFCGGGPRFPKVHKVIWKDARTVIARVTLQPDQNYIMSLNCPSARNFVARNGAPLRPTPWGFSTAPDKPLDPAAQRAANSKAAAELAELLSKRYSYFDTHKLDLDKLRAVHFPKLLAAPNHRAFAAAAAAMLRSTNDLHLYFRYRGQVYGAGSRRIDPLFRAKLLPKYLGGKLSRSRNHIFGHSKQSEEVAYLLLANFTRLDPKAILAILTAQRQTKTLILDLRTNSGGNELLARQIAAVFIKGNKVYAKHRYRIAPGTDGFGQTLERRIQGVKDSERYPGQVYVLMSRYCMSSCEAFLLMMKQAENCKLIGQRSYGSSGNPRRHALSNGVAAFIPSWQALLPDGSRFETKGIRPDIEVQANPQELQTRDPILEKALELAR